MLIVNSQYEVHIRGSSEKNGILRVGTEQVKITTGQNSTCPPPPFPTKKVNSPFVGRKQLGDKFNYQLMSIWMILTTRNPFEQITYVYGFVCHLVSCCKRHPGWSKHQKIISSVSVTRLVMWCHIRLNLHVSWTGFRVAEPSLSCAPARCLENEVCLAVVSIWLPLI